MESASPSTRPPGDEAAPARSTCAQSLELAAKAIALQRGQLASVAALTRAAALDLVAAYEAIRHAGEALTMSLGDGDARGSSEALAAARSLRPLVTEALAVAQFEDVVRQRLEHVDEALSRCEATVAHAALALRGEADLAATPEVSLDALAASYVTQGQRAVHADAVGSEVPSEDLPSIELF